MNDWMESCFHLAYSPASNSKPVDVSISDCAEDRVISLRSASSLRLYRCHSLHPREVYNSFHADYPSGISTAGIDRKCPCCCYRGERCSHDPLFPLCSSDESFTTRTSNEFEQNTDVDNANSSHPSASGEATMLAVLVPSELTRRITDLLHNVENRKVDKEIFDAEEDLRMSIHPCLCEIEPRINNHLDIHQRLKDQLSSNIEENAASPQIYVRGIITSHNVSNCSNFPADVVLLAPTHPSEASIQHNGRRIFFDVLHFIMHFGYLLNHDTASNAPWSVLKAFPVSSLSLISSPVDFSTNITTVDPEDKAFDIAALPCCTVCLNLIEPTRVGLPELKQKHKCSRWCLSLNDVQLDDTGNGPYSQHRTCANEMNFIPSPQCAACQVIFQSVISPAPLWSEPHVNRLDQQSHEASLINRSCFKCGMTSNLWVCLTCGVVGCGRYTRKHAENHYTSMGHPFSYELATGRIWDYDNGKFVHRIDLTECPVLSMKLGRSVAGAKCPNFSSPLAPASLVGFSGQGGNVVLNRSSDGWSKENYSGESDRLGDSVTQCHSNLEANLRTPGNASKLPTPKKSIMISQEYEALLQSALEDQAQHYQGEISRLRAQSVTSRMQDSEITDRESREIDALRMDSDRLKQDLDNLSVVLLEDQRREATNRALSQRLLREQSISKDLLENIRKETAMVLEKGKQRVEELEMQIADLAANLRMMSQFAANEELNQAQICGTVGAVKDSGEKGRKQRGKQARRGRNRG
jgi:hypothetical protein